MTGGGGGYESSNKRPDDSYILKRPDAPAAAGDVNGTALAHTALLRDVLGPSVVLVDAGAERDAAAGAPAGLFHRHPNMCVSVHFCVYICTDMCTDVDMCVYIRRSRLCKASAARTNTSPGKGASLDLFDPDACVCSCV